MPIQFYSEPAGTVGAGGGARVDITTPRVVTGAEAADAAARYMDAQTNELKVRTSLIDQAWNSAINNQKAQADIAETAARGRLYGVQADNYGDEMRARIGLQDAQADNMRAESENRRALGPLQVDAEKQRIRSQGYLLDEAERQNNVANKAWGEVDDYRKEIGALDWQDPDIDAKIATIRNKYPDAHTYGQTEGMVAPVIQDLYARRGQSTKLQYNAGLMAGLERMQQPDQALISPNVDVRQEVINGNGTALLGQANLQAASKRLQRILAEPTVNDADKADARRLLNQVNAAPGTAQQPIGVDGSLNADTDTQIGGIERKYGITPQYPNAKMTLKRAPNKDTGKMETSYEISGMPPTAEDIEAARGVGAAGATIDYTKDPLFNEAIGQVNSEPGTYKNDADRAKAVWDRYNKLHTDRGIPLPGQEAAQPAAQPPAPYTKPAPGQAPPVLPVQPGQPGAPAARPRHRPLSEAEQPGGFQLASYEPGAEGAAGPTDRLRTSNNDYAFPQGAGDVLGINRNVWANVMSEEGPGFGVDPGTNHMSVFGLWADAPGDEGQAYRVAREYGANSPEAFNAVTAAWTNVFLRRSEPWRLDSPGLQEMVIADSQHVGGAAARTIINEMGGFDAVNRMNPAEAIRTYAELRLPLWRGNAARVGREMNWALRHDATLRGGGAQPAPAAATVT